MSENFYAAILMWSPVVILAITLGIIGIIKAIKRED